MLATPSLKMFEMTYHHGESMVSMQQKPKAAKRRGVKIAQKMVRGVYSPAKTTFLANGP
jgi:hypothetical protein